VQLENEKMLKSIQLLHSFWNVQKNLIKLAQKSAIENGLSVPQYSILMAMKLNKEMIQKNVGEVTFLPKSTLSQAVDGLVREGIINRQQVEGNRREIMLSVTEKGEALIKDIYLQEDGIHQVFHSVVEDMSDSQYDELLRGHLQITTFLETEAHEIGECKK
jgi:DNA-binding MarR family transcriptional regulator